MIVFTIFLCVVVSCIEAKFTLNNVVSICPAAKHVGTGLKMSTVTWNHAEISPTMRDCEFLRNLVNDDLIMLGLQECEDIRPRRNEGSRSRKWREIRESMLKKTHDCIVDHKLGGMQLALYCKKTSDFPFKEFKVIEVPCGVGNVIGNKGAIALILKYGKQQSLALINCHLAAHDSKVSQRNADYRRIVQSILAETPSEWLLKTPSLGKSQTLSSLLPSSSSSRTSSFKWNPSLNKYFTGSVFMGDFNYRLEVSRQEVNSLQDMYEKMKKERLSSSGGSGSANKEEAQTKVIETVHKLQRESTYTQGVDVTSSQFRKFLDQLELIQDLDQLTTEKEKGRILKGFSEGEILFPPTYKYDQRSTRFDTSKKARCPAWTDRILYSVSRRKNDASSSSYNGRDIIGSSNVTGVQTLVSNSSTNAVNGTALPVGTKPPLLVLNRYSSLDVRSSDHRPVYASFTINL